MKLHGTAWMCNGRSGCHVAHEESHSALLECCSSLLECRSAVLECGIALGPAMTLTPWWANPSRLSNARLTFLRFLKNIYFIRDNETLS